MGAQGSYSLAWKYILRKQETSFDPEQRGLTRSTLKYAPTQQKAKPRSTTVIKSKGPERRKVQFWALTLLAADSGILVPYTTATSDHPQE